MICICFDHIHVRSMYMVQAAGPGRWSTRLRVLLVCERLRFCVYYEVVCVCVCVFICVYSACLYTVVGHDRVLPLPSHSSPFGADLTDSTAVESARCVMACRSYQSTGINPSRIHYHLTFNIVCSLTTLFDQDYLTRI
jgi:hypothetical protein